MIDVPIPARLPRPAIGTPCRLDLTAAKVFPRVTLPRRTALLGLAAASLARTASAANQHLRIGIMAGEDEDVWHVVAANAAQRGLALAITTFNDYNEPNEALAEHELDANAFQHKPYLDAQIAARGYRIVPIGFTYLQPIGLYSRKHATLAALPSGAAIGVPNDPSNEGRALLLLQSLGLITLGADVGLLPTALDIATNPKNIAVKELDAGIVGRAIGDLDAAVVNTDWAIKSGIRVPGERLAQESADASPYRNFIAVNAADQHAPWATALVASYQQPNVAAAILKAYRGATRPAW